MKTILHATLLTLCMGSVGTAYAGDGEDPIANTRFTQLADVVAQPAEQYTGRTTATAASGAAIFTTQQQANAAFPWNANEGVGQ